MHYNKNVEHNLAARLKEALGSAEWALLHRIAAGARELHLPLYVVGGVPRDLILGQPISDLDLVVEGDAHALARLLRSKYGGKVTFHGKFGTAKWDIRESRAGSQALEEQIQSIDLVTARSETYKHPAALPTVQPGSIADDLRRRDFTINALAVRLDAPHTDEVRDDFGGWQDIRSGRIRVLHRASFFDDPTRLYRAVRYEQRYGFRIADDTLALIPAARRVVAKLSAQRIRHELDMTLDEPRVALMLARLAELDLLASIHPALSFDQGAARRIQSVESGGSTSLPEWSLVELRWLAWLLPLPQGEIQAVESRLHFAAGLYKALLAASDLWANVAALAGSSPSRWVERLDELPLMAVQAVYLSSPDGLVRDALENYLIRWRHVKPRTTGHELKRLGLQPGADYKEILSALRRAWLDREIANEHEEREYLGRLLARSGEK